jgi:hypothetical protein
MKKIIVLAVAAALAALLFSACNKDKYLIADALVKNINGDCGYVIYLDFNAFQPRNLPDSLMIDSLPVTISYKLLDQVPECYGDLPVKDMMHIRTIERKQ